MKHRSMHDPPAAPTDANEDFPRFVPALDMKDIFRQLIADELRNGQLTKGRRRRIVGYAAQLGLSAVEAGRMIAACREAAIDSEHATERFHALRLVEPPPPVWVTPTKVGLALIAAALLQWFVIRWLP